MRKEHICHYYNRESYGIWKGNVIIGNSNAGLLLLALLVLVHQFVR